MNKKIIILLLSILVLACRKEKEIMKPVLNSYKSTVKITEKLEPLFLGLNPEMKNHTKDSIIADLIKKGTIEEGTFGYTFVIPINEKNTKFNFTIGTEILSLSNTHEQEFIPNDWIEDRTLYQAETALKWKFESLYNIFNSKYQKGKYSDLINNEMKNYITSVFQNENKKIIISARVVEKQLYVEDYRKFKKDGIRFVNTLMSEHDKSLDENYIRGHKIYSSLEIRYYNNHDFDLLIQQLIKQKSEKDKTKKRKQDSISGIKNNKNLL